MIGEKHKPVWWDVRTGLRSLILPAAFLTTALLLLVVAPHVDRLPTKKYSIGFADGYQLIATNLANGDGYRWNVNMGETMMREPGYPLFLAAAFKIGGYSIEAARFANWLLTIGIACMIMRLTRMVTDDRSAPLIASLMFLLHPGTLIAAARGGVEILFIFVLLVFMLALHHAVEKGNSGRYFAAGLALGFVVLVRSTPLVFPVLFLLYLGFSADGARERMQAVLNVAILVLGMAIVMAPWVIRNYMLVHEFVPVATLQGVALQEGQYTCQNLSFGGDFYVLGKEAGRQRGELASSLGFPFEGKEYFQFFYDPHDEWAFNRLLFQRAKEKYAAHPGILVGCVGMNLFNFWFLGKTWQVTKLNMVLQLPLLVLACSGLYPLWQRGLLRKIGLILSFVLTIVAVHLPIVAEARYSIPVLAFLVIPASISVMSIWRKYSKHLGCGALE